MSDHDDTLIWGHNRHVIADATVVQDTSLGCPALRTYLTLCIFRNRELGKAWPSQQLLSGILGYKVPKISAAIRELERAGHLEIRQRHQFSCRWPRNVYSLPFGEELSRVIIGTFCDKRRGATDLRVLVALGRWMKPQMWTLHSTEPGSKRDQIAASARYLALSRRKVRASIARLVSDGAIVEQPALMRASSELGQIELDDDGIKILVKWIRSHPAAASIDDLEMFGDIQSRRLRVWIAQAPKVRA